MINTIKQFYSKYFKSIKLVILLLILSFIFLYLFKNQVTLSNFISILQSLQFKQLLIYGIVVLVLMIINWLLEAFKWQYALSLFEKISFKKATKDVLIGLSLGTFSPLMAGDFLGRVQGLQNKKLGLIANAFCAGMQTLTSILLGFFALLFMYYNDAFNEYKYFIGWLILILGLVLLFAVFIICFPLKFQPFLPKNLKEDGLTFLNSKFLTKLFIISIIRNLIFAFQYYLVLVLFSIDLPFFELFWGINIIFLVKTIGGGLHVFGDLIIRQISSVAYFGALGIEPEPIIIATFGLWMINIMVPVLVGLYFFARIKK